MFSTVSDDARRRGCSEGRQRVSGSETGVITARKRTDCANTIL